MKSDPRPSATYRAERKAAARALAKSQKVNGAPSRQAGRNFRAFEAMRAVARAATRGEQA
ncbi:hypothetical protein ACUXK4_004545 [Methylorubrum extorquens]